LKALVVLVDPELLLSGMQCQTFLHLTLTLQMTLVQVQPTTSHQQPH
jgi:hypothetical protein